MTLRERARRASQNRPVVVQQQQDARVERQSRLNMYRGAVVTDRVGIGLSRSERLGDLLRKTVRQSRLLDRAERVRVEEHNE